VIEREEFMNGLVLFSLSCFALSPVFAQAPTAGGSKEIPTWGDAFRSIRRDESLVKLRVHNLTEYIESIQDK